MMFSKSFAHHFIDMISEMQKNGLSDKRGLFSPFPKIVPMNPSNPLTSSSTLHNFIMHTYCALHICHVLNVVSISGVLFPPGRT